MQKTMLLMAALLFSLFISGCGGGGTSTSVVYSTNDTLTASVLNKNTFHIVPLKGTAITTFLTYSGSGATRTWSGNSQDLNVIQGTWSVPASGGPVTFSNFSGITVKTITGIQNVPTKTTPATTDYWLVSVLDRGAAQSVNCRMYIEPTTTTTFGSYTTSTAFKIGLIGGTVQKTQLPATFSNVSTVVGVTNTFGFRDYTAAHPNPPALLGRPVAITTTDGKNFFVLDNLNNLIRMISHDPSGVRLVKTLKANSTSAIPIIFNAPADITTDGKNLYVTDTNSFVIRQIVLDFDSSGNPIGTGTMTSLSGSGVAGSVDGTGNTFDPATGAVKTVGTARFAGPIGITTDGTNLYVTDNRAIRKVKISDGSVTTLAGVPGLVGWADSTDNTGKTASFNLLTRITTDGTNLYVADANNLTIRQVVIATGAVTTIAGSVGVAGSHDDFGNKATFSGPEGITTDGTSLFVTDWGKVLSGNPATGQTIRMIKPDSTGKFSASTSTVTTIAGTSRNDIGSDLGPVTGSALSAHFDCPAGITTDGTSLFVADVVHFTIRRIYNR